MCVWGGGGVLWLGLGGGGGGAADVLLLFRFQEPGGSLPVVVWDLQLCFWWKLTGRRDAPAEGCWVSQGRCPPLPTGCG